jgi:hypothetical protein
MRLVFLLAAGMLLVLACSGGHDKDRPPVTERERDSVIGSSRLPGAQGVGRALRASDSAGARRAVEDSIAREP